MRAHFGEFTLDTDRRQLLSGGRVAHLTPKAFALLEYLIEKRPRALTKSQILEHVWPATFVSEANLASLVKEIRKALGDDPRESRYVRTVRGFGYSFAGGVREERETGPLPDPSPSPSGQTEFRVIWNRQEIALAEGENVLGRTRQARVWVDHSSVSRRHAVIRVHDDQATLEDCASKNGTFLRGQRLKAAATLKDGDELILGRARLVFRAHTVEVSTATSTGE